MRKNNSAFTTGVVVSVVLCGLALFQGVSDSYAAAESTGPFLLCQPAKSAPAIDGKLDDACWKAAVEAGNFTLASGTGFALEPTSAWVSSDTNGLLLAFRCRQKTLDPVLNQLDRFKASTTERDSMKVFEDDTVEIFLACGEDPSGYYHIVVNSLGTVYDSSGFATPESWTAKIAAKGAKGNGEWTLEMRIPFADLGKTPKSGDVWRINLCRNNATAGEFSSWAPVPLKFHSPGSFGYLQFGETGVAVAAPKLAPPHPGENELAVPVTNPGSQPLTCALRMLAWYDREEVVRETSVEVAPGATRELKIRYSVSPDNRCLRLIADNKGIMASHTGRIPVKPDTTYRFSAMVKTKDFNYPAKAYNLFVLHSFREDGTPFPDRGYEGISALVTNSENWVLVEGTWKPTPGTASVILWIVSWPSHGSGTIWMDDLTLTEEGRTENLLANGTFPKGEESFGWPVIGAGCSFDDSYGVGAGEFTYCYQIGANTNLAYRSPKFTQKVEKPWAIINSFLNHIMPSCGYGREFMVLPVRDLALAEDTVQEICLVLTSPTREKVKQTFFQMDLPRCCRLVNYFTPDDKAGPVPVAWEEKDIVREGKPYHRYRLTFGQDAVIDCEALPPGFLSVPLLIKIDGPAPADKTGVLAYRAFLEDGQGDDRDHVIPLKFLPLLNGKRPATLPVICYPDGPVSKQAGYGSKGKALVYASRTAAGFNMGNAGSLPGAEYTDIPPMFLGGASVWSTNLAAHPELAERTSDNRENRDAVCMTQLLDKQSPFWGEIQAVINDWVRQSPNQVDLDFEFGVCEGAGSGFSEANVALFRKRANIPADVALTPEKILKEYRSQWIDFRCWENGEFTRLYREFIKKANPDCLFTMFSGWQGAGTTEAYGVDWKYMGPSVDLVICGYDRGTPEATMKAAGKEYVCGGELVEGSYDLDSFENTFFQRLTECGSVLACYSRCFDGRFYQGVSRVAAVAADFEDFFLHLKRDNSLVEGTDGQARGDVHVLTRGPERLLVIFNNSQQEKKAVLKNKAVPAGAVVLDYDTKQLLKNAETIEALVPPWSVKTLYLAVPTNQENRQVTAPIMPLEKQTTESEFPVLRWQDPAGRTHRYTVQYSQDRAFKDVTIVRDLVQPFCRVEKPLALGKSWFWRVKTTDTLTGKESDWSALAELVLVPSQASMAVPKSGKPANEGLDRLGYWYFDGSAGRDYDVTYTKTYSVKIKNLTGVSSGNASTYNPAVGTRMMPVQPGEQYTFHTKVKIEGKSEAMIQFSVHDKNGRFLPNAAPQKMKGNGDWRDLSVSVTIPDGAVCLGFCIIASGGPGTVWFDDFSVKKQ